MLTRLLLEARRARGVARVMTFESITASLQNESRFSGTQRDSLFLLYFSRVWSWGPSLSSSSGGLGSLHSLSTTETNPELSRRSGSVRSREMAPTKHFKVCMHHRFEGPLGFVNCVFMLLMNDE